MKGLLLELTTALKAQGLWQQTAPPASDLASLQPFAVDCLTFAQWLQFVYEPRMQQLLLQGLPVPSGQLAPMAEMSWAGQPCLAELLPILQRLDRA